MENAFDQCFNYLLTQDIRIDKQLQSGLRVTVQLNKTQNQGRRQTLISFLMFAYFLFFAILSLRNVFVLHIIKCLPVRHPQTAKYIKVSWWLLMCPGRRVVSTGVTVCAWHHVSVRTYVR